MHLFSFKFQHPSALRYVWLVVLAPIVCVVPAILLVEDNVALIIASVFAPIVIGFYLLFTKGKAQDEISLDNSGFTSAFFGRVQFNEIKAVKGSSLFMDPPSIRIELNNGRKLTWRITSKGSIYNSVEDAETFLRFTAELSLKMDAWAPRAQVRQSTLSYEKAPPSEQLRKVVKRNRKPALAIPIGAAFALLALVRTCGKDWFKRDDINFAQIAAQQEEKYQSNIGEAKAVMSEYLKRQGAHFLYTNDTAARAELLPDINVSDPTGIAAFRHTEANRELEAFIENPDSFRIQTVIIAGDGSVKPMRGSILNMNDSADVQLFIRFYDPQQRIAPPRMRGAAPVDSSEFPVFDVMTGIPLYDTLKIGGAISESFPAMHMMLAQVRHRSSFRVYLTGREKDGISETLFRNAVRELNKQLAAVKADTSGFVVKMYNR